MLWEVLGKVVSVIEKFIEWAFQDWKHIIIFAIIIVVLDLIATGRFPVLTRKKSNDDGDE